MRTATNDLWPEVMPGQRTPQPLETLRQQGVILSERTAGQLYGEALTAGVPSATGLRYTFFIGVQAKPVRYKLLSIEVPTLADYPVTIENHEAGSVTIVPDQAAFEGAVKLILASPATQEVIGKLLNYAS